MTTCSLTHASTTSWRINATTPRTSACARLPWGRSSGTREGNDSKMPPSFDEGDDETPRSKLAAPLGRTALQRAASLAGEPRRLGDALDDGIEVSEDLMIRDAQHRPAEAQQHAVAPRIVAHTLGVILAIELDDEPHLGAREVDDGVGDDELPPKRKPDLRPRQPTPDPLLGARGAAAHEARALLEQPSLCRRDERASKHGDLHVSVSGAGARRAESPSAASVPRAPRQRRDASWPPPRAARKVRVRSSARSRAAHAAATHSDLALPISSYALACALPTHADAPPPSARRRVAPSTDKGEACGEAARVGANHQRPKLAGGGTADAAVPATLGGQPVVLDAGGRVTSLRGATLTYDERGNFRGAADPIPAQPESYFLDASFRRFLTSKGSLEFSIYEGLDRIAVMNGTFDFTTHPTTVKETYLFDGIDHPLRITIPASSTTAYYEVDLAGNVRGLRASGGADLGGYRYSAFGKTLEDTAAIDQPLRWKGRWFSPIAGGIYDVRARQWSPELGAFLSVDEFRYHSAKTTLWGWPGMSPVRLGDPQGHGPISDAILCALFPFLCGDCGLAGCEPWRDPHEEWKECRDPFKNYAAKIACCREKTDYYPDPKICIDPESPTKKRFDECRKYVGL